MIKTIYYYYDKFPTGEIKSFKVEDIYYIVKENDKDYKYVYGIDTYYDLVYEKYINDEDYVRYYSLSTEWQDKEVFQYTNGLAKITLSFDKEKLKKCQLEDIERFETIYGKYVDECRKILKDSDVDEKTI